MEQKWCAWSIVSEVNGAIFSPDGSYIVSRGWDGTARVTRVSDGAEVVRVEHGA